MNGNFKRHFTFHIWQVIIARVLKLKYFFQQCLDHSKTKKSKVPTKKKKQKIQTLAKYLKIGFIKCWYLVDALLFILDLNHRIKTLNKLKAREIFLSGFIYIYLYYIYMYIYVAYDKIWINGGECLEMVCDICFLFQGRDFLIEGTSRTFFKYVNEHVKRMWNFKNHFPSFEEFALFQNCLLSILKCQTADCFAEFW